MKTNENKTMQRTAIILTGPRGCGKTLLAKLLTYNGQAGAYFDVRDDGLCDATTAEIKGMLHCPRVVICAENSNAARAHANLKDLFRDRQTIVIKVEHGDCSSIIPTRALASPPAFREWLLNFGNNTFEGGQIELNRIIEQLPPHASVVDLRKISSPYLKMT